MRIGYSPKGNTGSDGSGNNGGFEDPPADIYEAVICCIEDVGHHNDPGKPGVTNPMIVVGIELVDCRDSKGRPFALFSKMRTNLWSSPTGDKCSNFRKFLDTVLPGEVASVISVGAEIDTDKWVGKTVRVNVETNARGRAVIKNFLKSKKPEAVVEPERDWSQPFGLWRWLIQNAARPPAGA